MALSKIGFIKQTNLSTVHTTEVQQGHAFLAAMTLILTLTITVRSGSVRGLRAREDHDQTEDDRLC